MHISLVRAWLLVLVPVLKSTPYTPLSILHHRIFTTPHPSPTVGRKGKELKHERYPAHSSGHHLTPFGIYYIEQIHFVNGISLMQLFLDGASLRRISHCCGFTLFLLVHFMLVGVGVGNDGIFYS